MGRFDTPVADLTPDELKLYDVNIATIPMDVNFTPDYPLAASLFSTMYQDRIDPAPLDGVIAVDPVALADVLKGFAPVTVQGQQLDSDTVVKLLLSDAYTLFPNDWDQSQRDALPVGGECGRVRHDHRGPQRHECRRDRPQAGSGRAAGSSSTARIPTSRPHFVPLGPPANYRRPTRPVRRPSVSF